MKKNKYIEEVAEQANVLYKEARNRMNYIREKYGLSYESFCKNKLYYQDEIRLSQTLDSKARSREENKAELEKACRELNIDEATLKKQADDLSLEYGYPIGWKTYFQQRMDLMSAEEIEDLTSAMREEKYLRSNLKKTVGDLPANSEEIENLNSEVDRLEGYLQKIMSAKDREENVNVMADYIKDPSSIDPELLDTMILDIQAMRRIFSISPLEYFLYDFPQKTLTERSNFLSLSEKRKYTEKVCNPFDADSLSSKWQTYLRFQPYYYREALLVDSEDAFQDFQAFCQNHERCIVKPPSELSGGQIRILDLQQEQALTCRQLFDDMLSSGSFLVEEFLTQCPELEAFHPASINTIRLISIHTGDKIELRWPLIRIGVDDLEIDRPEAGALFAAIDPATGKIITHASDQSGQLYYKHPDSDIRFINFRIPKWKKLLSLCRKLAKKVPTVKYIGWDFCLTSNYDWALVEANIQPGCKAYQTVTKSGIRGEFLEIFQAMENTGALRDKHVLSVSRKMKVSYKTALEIMTQAQESYGFSFAYYDSHDLQNMNDIRLKKRAASLAELAAKNQVHYTSLLEKAGMTQEEVDSLIQKVKITIGYTLPVRILDEFELYRLPEKEFYHKIMLFAKEQDLIKGLQNKLSLFDQGKASFDDMNDAFSLLHAISKGNMGGSLQVKLETEIRENMPDRIFKDQELLDLITDMQVTKAVMGFSSMEYQIYHLEKKTFEQRYTFLSQAVRVEAIRSVNDKEFAEICDNKYLAYHQLPEAFGREVVLIRGEEDYQPFVEFCANHEEFVKKPLSEARGDGVELIKLSDYKNLRQAFDYLLKTPDGVVIEGLIIQNEKMAVFNKDSVNTVRIITFNYGDSVDVIGSFFRTGRNGTFVDNAGAGGVFAIPDLETGIIASDGISENGASFLTHPDSGVIFRGYQIPDWELLTAKAKKFAAMLPEMTIIGWDFAYTKDGEWLVIEYNSRPEFLHQSNMETGVRTAFLAGIEKVLKNS